MGKNKKRKSGSKDAMFKVAGNKVKKVKNKSKEVTTNLKKLNVHTKTLTEKSDNQLSTLRKDLPVTETKPATARVASVKKVDPQGKPTLSAHPSRFSPDDKYSRHRITIKKRFGLLLTQQPKPVW